jgi:hypothetical protein
MGYTREVTIHAHTAKVWCIHAGYGSAVTGFDGCARYQHTCRLDDDMQPTECYKKSAL